MNYSVNDAEVASQSDRNLILSGPYEADFKRCIGVLYCWLSARSIARASQGSHHNLESRMVSKRVSPRGATGKTSTTDTGGGRCSQDTKSRYFAASGQAFAERMLQLARKGIATSKNRTYRSAPLFRAHDERQAQRLLNGGLAAAGLSTRELDSLPGSDVRKVALANLLLERTVARQSWIADKLAMRSAANVSQQVRRYRTQRSRLSATLKEYLESAQSVKIC